MVAGRRYHNSGEKGKADRRRVNNVPYNNNNKDRGHLSNSVSNNKDDKNGGNNNTDLDTFGEKDTATSNTLLLDRNKNSLSDGIAIPTYQAKQSHGHQSEIDELDIQLLSLLTRGYDNKQIADKIDNPLSTIQRRTRLIFERGLASSKIEPDYAKLGYKKGFLILRLKSGKIADLLERLQKISGIISISANVGIFPLICVIIYRNTGELWNMISNVQELDSVKEVLWSEEVCNFDTKYNITHFPPA
jgi:DNA-binding Lrp family transcriptional regulator